MTLTKSWLQKQITDLEATRDEIPFGLDEDGNNTLAAFKTALAGMEAVPVGVTDKSEIECLKCGEMANVMPPDYKGCDSGDSVYLYDGPQPLTTPERAELENYRNAQQVVPDFGALTKLIVQRLVDCGGADDDAIARCEEFVYNSCRAAMLQGKAEPVTTAYKLPDDFDFDRFNDVVWLEAVASNPHMHSLMTSTIAMVALELNRRLDADGKPELTAWYGPMPESIGKTNWTAMLHRKGQHPWEGITIDCSEYPDRTLYEADRMRYLIGELAEDPDILAYDADKHSGYVTPGKADGNSPAIPDGWVIVPVEPTDAMVEAMYKHQLSMRGALKAAIAAAPQQEAE